MMLSVSTYDVPGKFTRDIYPNQSINWSYLNIPLTDCSTIDRSISMSKRHVDNNSETDFDFWRRPKRAVANFWERMSVEHDPIYRGLRLISQNDHEAVHNWLCYLHENIPEGSFNQRAIEGEFRGDTLLLLAAKACDIGMMKVLLHPEFEKFVGELEDVDHSGTSALTYLIYRHKFECVSAFVAYAQAHHVPLFHREHDYVMDAARAGNASVMRCLIQNGASIIKVTPNEETYRTTAIAEACFYGKLECVQILLLDGAYPKYPDPHGMSLSYLAVTGENDSTPPQDVVKILELLIEYGEDIAATYSIPGVEGGTRQLLGIAIQVQHDVVHRRHTAKMMPPELKNTPTIAFLSLIITECNAQQAHDTAMVVEELKQTIKACETEFENYFPDPDVRRRTQHQANSIILNRVKERMHQNRYKNRSQSVLHALTVAGLHKHTVAHNQVKHNTWCTIMSNVTDC